MKHPPNETSPTGDRAYLKNANNAAPPKGTGRASDNAARPDPTATRLITQLREVNGVTPTAWTQLGWWMVGNYQRSGNAKDLQALECHLAGVHSRMTMATDGH